MLKAGTGWTEIFIYPGYRFKVLDALITNFHLPPVHTGDAGQRAGRTGSTYWMPTGEAVKEGYRFFLLWGTLFIAAHPAAEKR